MSSSVNIVSRDGGDHDRRNSTDSEHPDPSIRLPQVCRVELLLMLPSSLNSLYSDNDGCW